MAEEAVTLLKQFYATGNPKGLPIAHPGLNPMVMFFLGSVAGSLVACLCSVVSFTGT